MLRRLCTLIRKELAQLRRDPVLLVLMVWLFTIEVVLCSYALTFDLNDAAIAVEDLDATPASRALVDRLERSPDFRVAAHTTGEGGLERLLDRGDAVAVVQIAPGWSEALHGRGEGSAQLLVDGSNAGTAAAVRAYLLALVQREVVAESAAAGAGVPAAALTSRTRVWFNSALRTVDFMVLSMLALAALMVAVIHPAASLVKEKEAGTLEQLLISPMGAGELVAAKLLVTLATSLAGLTLSLGIVWWFEVPVRGSLVLFYLASVIFLGSAMALGVVVASVSKNLQQALLLAFFGLIPVMFLSGTLVPLESMPRPVQLATLVSPLRYYMDALLGIFLKGSGWDLLWPDLAAMAGLAVVLLALALWWLKRRPMAST